MRRREGIGDEPCWPNHKRLDQLRLKYFLLIEIMKEVAHCRTQGIDCYG
ncbi:hypothetical protein KUC_0262 [Vreelandella boliviensis LC1]|uniref:Uncharacterized protein n=1 Tax=Vreelandella boliviensis LC1 TaxID=1072583 RepID=A0A7U9GHU5_9GAMM|nr:hypothetical protein KUC_0262 [Halomonas boliviensis LC1]